MIMEWAPMEGWVIFFAITFVVSLFTFILLCAYERKGKFIPVLIGIFAWFAFWSSYNDTYADTVDEYRITIEFSDGSTVIHDDVWHYFTATDGGGFLTELWVFIRHQHGKPDKIYRLNSIRTWEAVKTGEHLSIRGRVKKTQMEIGRDID